MANEKEEYYSFQELLELKDSHDSNVNWQLKLKFLEAHYEKVSKKRLLTDINLYLNIKTMGCSYPPEIMERIEAMAKEVPENEEILNKPKKTLEKPKSSSGYGPNNLGGRAVNLGGYHKRSDSDYEQDQYQRKKPRREYKPW